MMYTRDRTMAITGEYLYPQDLHIHSTYSRGDASVVPEQTPELIARVRHARVIGISDHFELFADTRYDEYVEHIRSLNLLVGTEVDGFRYVAYAAALNFDYYIYHCRDTAADYAGIEQLLATGCPVIIAHPNILATDLKRVPSEALIEINNRYIWCCDWMSFYQPHLARFRFVINSDAHQPNWLGQSLARRVATELGIVEQPITELLKDASYPDNIDNGR